MSHQRKVLVIALAVALSGVDISLPAQGVEVATEHGLGEVLIYPYYTVQNGRQTSLSVINNTGQVKIIKVRFREGKNSREVLDFNLFLSPFDVWMATLQQNPLKPNDGVETEANIRTSDGSCTIGSVVGAGTSGVNFVNFDYSGLRNDNGGEQLSRTREGYAEMFEMGVIDDTTLDGGILADAATHPVDCDVLRDAYFGTLPIATTVRTFGTPSPEATRTMR